MNMQPQLMTTEATWTAKWKGDNEKSFTTWRGPRYSPDIWVGASTGLPVILQLLQSSFDGISYSAVHQSKDFASRRFYIESLSLETRNRVD